MKTLVNYFSNNLNYNIILNYLIVLYAFCIPLSKAGISLFGILLILFWLMERNFKDKINLIQKEKIIILIILFLTLSFFSILWSSDKIFALDYLKKYWHFLILPIIYTSLKKDNIKFVFNAFLFSMLISEIVSYGIFFELWTKDGISPTDPSPFVDHTSYSCFLAFTSFILIYKIVYSSNLTWRYFYIIYFLTALTNLFINGGRTGQVIFVIGILFIVLKFVKTQLRNTTVAFIFVSLLITLFYHYSPIFKNRLTHTYSDLSLMINEKNYTGSFSARIAMWKLGIQSFTYQPILGNGIGDEASNIIKEIEEKKLSYFISSNNIYYYVDFHNMFIQYLSQLGIFGIIIILLIFYYMFKIKINNSRLNDLKNLFVILYLLWSIVALTFHINTSLTFFILFLGLFLKYSINSKEQLNVI